MRTFTFFFCTTPYAERSVTARQKSRRLEEIEDRWAATTLVGVSLLASSHPDHFSSVQYRGRFSNRVHLFSLLFLSSSDGIGNNAPFLGRWSLLLCQTVLRSSIIELWISPVKFRDHKTVPSPPWAFVFLSASTAIRIRLIRVLWKRLRVFLEFRSSE